MSDQHPDERIGRRELALGRTSNAVQHLVRALADRPDRLDLVLDIARLQFGLGEYMEAAERCESVIDRPSEHRHLLYRVLVYSLLNAGRPDRVRRIAEQAYEATGESWFLSIALQASNACDDLSPSEIMDLHKRLGTIIHAKADRKNRAEAGVSRQGPIRVGLLSGDLVTHPVTRFLEPMLAAIDRSRFEFVVFSNTLGSDATTSRLRLLSGAWHDVSKVTDDGCAAIMREASLDVLLDLGGHMFTGRPGVLAREPAPAVATWLGYPNTTGIPGVGWRIVDEITDPPDLSLTTERLIRIDPPFLCYTGPDVPISDPIPSDRGIVVFGSFNNLVKLSSTCLRLWGEVLRAVPNSRLLLKTRGLECSATRSWIESRFRNQGVPPHRLDLRGWCDGLEAHYGAYAEVDIALDTFPYNGTTTTCDALWSGVPVVTRVGEDHRSRVGASLLHSVGLADLATTTDSDFRDAASRLAEDVERRRRLRSELRDRVRLGPLGDVRSFADRFSHALEAICGRRAGERSAVDARQSEAP